MSIWHVYLDNARYHHARLVQDWLAQPGCRIRLHFLLPYCPASQPHRAALGPHARARHPQQMLRHMRPVRRCHTRLPAPKGSRKLAAIPRQGHRQFPRHFTQRISGSDVNRVYYPHRVIIFGWSAKDISIDFDRHCGHVRRLVCHGQHDIRLCFPCLWARACGSQIG
jgi:hypothetical protein